MTLLLPAQLRILDSDEKFTPRDIARSQNGTDRSSRVGSEVHTTTRGTSPWPISACVNNVKEKSKSSERINGSLAYLRGSLFLIGCMNAFQLFDWSLVCEVCECVI